MWDDYEVPSGTYRENMLREPGQALSPEDHRSQNFNYKRLKKFQEENGDITIDREDLARIGVNISQQPPNRTVTMNGLKASEQPEAVKLTA